MASLYYSVALEINTEFHVSKIILLMGSGIFSSNMTIILDLSLPSNYFLWDEEVTVGVFIRTSSCVQ